MKKYRCISIFIFIITITLPCLGIEPTVYKIPKKTIQSINPDTSKRYQNNRQRTIDTPEIIRQHSVDTPEIIAMQDGTEQNLEQQGTKKSPTITVLPESQNKNIYRQQLITNPKLSIESNTLSFETQQETASPENEGFVIPVKENQNLFLPFNQKVIDIDTENNNNPLQKTSSKFNQKSSYNKQNKSSYNNTEDDTAPSDLARLFSGFMNKSLFLFFSQQHLMSADINFSDITIDQAFLEGIITVIFAMEEKLQTIKNSDFDNFKMQIQYLAEQIKKYNTTSVYNNVDQMLLFIKFMNQFLKENNILYFSQAMSLKVDDVVATSSTCCDIIRNQNIILSSKSTPDKVLSFFQPMIETTNQLANSSDSYKTMHRIYDANGNMDCIIQRWKKFQSTRLYKTPLNRQYGAFITFLLLFENSIIATAIILDKTSTLYKVTNKVPVVINIA